MAIFFRGDGPGTHWQINDAQATGFTALSRGITHSASRTMHHIARTLLSASSPVASPYISLTTSRDVAWMYAIIGKGRYASQSDPGYIYEIEINADPKDAKYTRLVDPVKEIAGSLLDPPTGKYQHDDFPGILLGIVAPRLTVPFLRAGIIRPPSRPVCHGSS